jgi:hypothetical protein
MFASRCPAWVWKSVFDLNAIRNKVAHDLECNYLPDLIEEFEENVEVQDGGGMAFGEELGFARFPMAIVTVHGHLWTLLKSNVA